jgi:hypothetical protein
VVNALGKGNRNIFSARAVKIPPSQTGVVSLATLGLESLKSKIDSK